MVGLVVMVIRVRCFFGVSLLSRCHHDDFQSIVLCHEYTCQPPVFPVLALVGGALWCTGNVLTAFIVRYIGLGMGLLTWASAQMLIGWASGFFGIFGVPKASLSNRGLNAAGVSIAILALVVYVIVSVKPHRRTWSSSDAHETDSENEGLLPSRQAINRDDRASPVPSSLEAGMLPPIATPTPIQEKTEFVALNTPSPTPSHSPRQKLLGIAAALVAGVLYGVNMNPATHYQHEHDDKDPFGRDINGLDLVFAQFSGILGHQHGLFHDLRVCEAQQNPM